MAASKPRKKLNDVEFIHRFLELESRGSALAKELGVTRQNINARVKRLAHIIEQAKSSESGAALAGIVKRTIPESHTAAVVKARSFQEGIENAGRQYHIFDHLEDLYLDIKDLLESVKTEINKSKTSNKPIKPYHIDQVVKLVNQSRGLITDAHKIKLDLTQAKNVETFIGIMLSIIQQYDPMIKEKIYVELSGLGLEGQTALFVAADRPGGGGPRRNGEGS